MALPPNWTFVDSVSELTNGLTYTEDKNSGKTMGIKEDESSYERCYIMRNGPNNIILQQFLDDVVGFSTWNPGGGAGITSLNRILPDRDSIRRNFYAQNARTESLDRAGKSANVYPVPVHEYTRVFVWYAPADYVIASDAAIVDGSGLPREYKRFVRWHEDTKDEVITLSGHFRFRTSGRTLSHPPGKMHFTKLLKLEWLKVPHYHTDNPFKNPVEVNDLANRGKLNGSTFLGYRKGTMLYMGCQKKMVTPALANDSYYFNLTFNFAVKDNGTWTDQDLSTHAIGHNWLFDVSTGEWDLMRHEPSGNRIYLEDGDFNSLFIPV